MKFFKLTGAPSGIQQRLLMLLFVALLPLIGYVIALSFSQQHESLKQATLSVQTVSRLSAFGIERTVEGAHQLLNAITSGPSVRSRGLSALCREFLSNIGNDYAYYTNLVVLDLEGNLTCGALGMAVGVNYADRSYFKQALAARSFVIGDYQIGRTTGKPSIAFARPVLDNGGRLNGVAVVALDLSYLNLGLETPRPEMRVSVMDRNGTILASDGPQGGAVGTKFADHALYSAMSVLPSEPFEAPDASGEMRIYSVTAIRNDTKDAIFVVASIARNIVTTPAARQAWMGFFLLSLVTIAGLLVARWIAGKTLVDPTRRLLKDIHALAGDGFDGAKDAPKRVDELAALTSAFHRFAALLKTRDEDLKREHAALQEAQNLLAMATRVGQLGAWRVNPNQQPMLVELSDIACTIHGLPPGSTLAVDDAIDFLCSRFGRGYQGTFRELREQWATLRYGAADGQCSRHKNMGALHWASGAKRRRFDFASGGRNPGHFGSKAGRGRRRRAGVTVDKHPWIHQRRVFQDQPRLAIHIYQQPRREAASPQPSRCAWAVDAGCAAWC